MSLKLKLNTNQASKPSAGSPPAATTPSTPSIRLSFGGASSAVTPSSARPKSAKQPSFKKRQRDGDDDAPVPAKKRAPSLKIVPAKGPSMVKINTAKSTSTPKTATTPGILPRLKIKGKGRAPHRPLGVGYDSEAEDAEEDPAIEDEFVLRMQPGPDCEYLREAINNRTIGLPAAQGGAAVYMRFFKRDARRACVTIQGRHYAAVLVDLPCIVESMKSWDKKGWWKSADICQMLIVTGRVENEWAAEKAPLPREVDEKTWQWPHGLTPPMHDVRRRRFRKRVSYRTIEAAEDEVEKQLKLDDQARRDGGTTEADVLDLRRLDEEVSEEDDDQDDDQMDAEGELDEGLVDQSMYPEDGEEEDDDEEDAEDLAARMALEMGGDGEEEEEEVEAASIADMTHTGMSAAADGTENATSLTEALSSAEAAQQSGSATLGEVESASEDEDDDDEDEEVDDEDREQAQMVAQQREEIEHLSKEVEAMRGQLARSGSRIMKDRLLRKLESLEKDLASKKRAIGQEDDD